MSEPRDHGALEHEESDINAGAVLGFALGLLIVGVIVQVVVAMLFGAFTRVAERTPRTFPLAADHEQALPPEPRLQVHPREDLRELRAREDSMLHTYGWVDKESGIARIPIDEAMKLIVSKGLPVRQTGRDSR